MDSLLIAMFLALSVVTSAKTTQFLFKKAGRVTEEFDRILLDENSCRSTFEASKEITPRFSEREALRCPYIRADFGTTATRGHWPLAVCTLLENTPSILTKEGKNPCAYLSTAGNR